MSIPVESRLILLALRCEADDEGFLEYDPHRFHHEYVPDISLLEDHLQILQDAKHIELGVVGAQPVIRCLRFVEETRPQHTTPSRFSGAADYKPLPLMAHGSKTSMAHMMGLAVGSTLAIGCASCEVMGVLRWWEPTHYNTSSGWVSAGNLFLTTVGGGRVLCLSCLLTHLAEAQVLDIDDFNISTFDGDALSLEDAFGRYSLQDAEPTGAFVVPFDTDAPDSSTVAGGDGNSASPEASTTTSKVKPPKVDPALVRQVWESWQESTGRRQTQFTAQRKKLIERALGTHPPEDVLDAVRGWAKSAFHTGDNPNGRVYNDIELILRDARHVESFRDLERGSGVVTKRGSSTYLDDLWKDKSSEMAQL
ncbi:hypothetical protein [Ferrimicrobium acidiphilum]|uniref:hypothetical protein n=1 Tax=Ferrimicrobium acidiphilum TaxID=121039 RepID=UPI0023F33EAE|nr:hypothetical protein [Ferrimicrobium acidiphilum]